MQSSKKRERNGRAWRGQKWRHPTLRESRPQPTDQPTWTTLNFSAGCRHHGPSPVNACMMMMLMMMTTDDFLAVEERWSERVYAAVCNAYRIGKKWKRLCTCCKQRHRQCTCALLEAHGGPGGPRPGKRAWMPRPLPTSWKDLDSSIVSKIDWPKRAKGTSTRRASRSAACRARPGTAEGLAVLAASRPGRRGRSRCACPGCGRPTPAARS